ncbi:MAG: YihA family ribosome biosis GTP-binding protein [Pedosphaera sp.]|nr:YihA family ribosome biosis GTP-binding protein [Pedosphaera sp.]
MNITSAIFEVSAPHLDSCPEETLPEFAFIGRSNVGKSSLLNVLAGKKGLAKVSATPGFTKLINFFIMNKTWRLVDLPGYGYAHVARENKAKFNDAVNDYLENRPNLFCVFVLIDSRLTPQKIDLEFVQWLGTQEAQFVLVFTKTDKLTKAHLQKNIEAFTQSLTEIGENVPEVFTSSAVTKNGVSDLLNFIGETLKASA